MGVWYRIYETGQLYDRPKPEAEKKIVGPIVYWSPHWHEYTVIPPTRIGTLRNAIRKHENFIKVIEELGQKGFPVLLRALDYPFTWVDFYDILNRKGSLEMTTFYCHNYSRRVSPAICLANKVKWPQIPTPQMMEEATEIAESIIGEKDEEVKKRLRRELRKRTSSLDPYPLCRRCIMARKLEQESCLGVDFDPKDQGCTVCPDQVECCHLMRLRIEKLLEGYPKEVIKSLKKQSIMKFSSQELADKAWQDVNVNHKPMEVITMARKKKEEVEVEVVSRTPEAMTPEEKRKARRDARLARKKEAEAPAPTKKSKKKKEEAAPAKPVTKKAAAEGIKELLAELATVKAAGDNTAASKIRAKLRGLGYRLSDVKKAAK